MQQDIECLDLPFGRVMPNNLGRTVFEAGLSAASPQFALSDAMDSTSSCSSPSLIHRVLFNLARTATFWNLRHQSQYLNSPKTFILQVYSLSRVTGAIPFD
jgi:hypothetical protein